VRVESDWKRCEIYVNLSGESIDDRSNEHTAAPVLVVDDEKNMRLSLQTVLKDDRLCRRAVESAEEA